VTGICGCAGFARAVTGGKDVPNVIYADYTELNGDAGMEIEQMLRIDKEYRDKIERKISQKIALEICARLPKNDDESYKMLRSGYEIAKHMGWDAVAENYVLKSIHKATKKQHSKVMQA
jgi:hypothetical protein